MQYAVGGTVAGVRAGDRSVRNDSPELVFCRAVSSCACGVCIVDRGLVGVTGLMISILIYFGAFQRYGEVLVFALANGEGVEHGLCEMILQLKWTIML